MNCERCERRPAAPGKRWCPYCYQFLRAQALETQVRLLTADLQDRGAKLTARVYTKPLTQMEIDDARIVRCPRCDARKMPDSPHSCKRVTA